MPTNQVFLWIANFLVDKDVEWSFRTFMETNHFFELNKTGCFEETVVTISKPADDPELPDFMSVTFIHVVKEGKIGWQKYEIKRGDLKKHFSEFCDHSIKSGKLIFGEQEHKFVALDWLKDLLVK